MRTMIRIMIFKIVGILLLFSFSVSYAQEEQDYKKWLENEQKRFQEFKDERDSAFVEFLKKEWRTFELFQGLVPDETPKPVDIPFTTQRDIPEDMIPEPSEIIREIHVPEEAMLKPAESVEIFTSKLKKEGEPLIFTFFDASLEVSYDTSMTKTSLKDPIDEVTIGEYWANLSRSQFENVLDQTKKLKDHMKLNDWGYCLLLNKIARKLYPGSKNERNLFIWFMITKSGYDSKVGYDDNEIYLLLPAKNVIYGAPFFELEEKRYYVVSFDESQTEERSIYTYDGSYPDAKNLIGLNIDNPPVIKKVMENKKLKFSYGNEEFIVNLKLKKDAIDFFQEYPQTDYEVYFNASLSPEARYSLINDLKPIIEGKSEVEAVNILLRFVQTAFKYEKDEIRFGREKPFFAEETLFYPSSDCEDRSVLFAYLVRNLIGLDVIGLDYPGHITTAVKFRTEIKGDYVEYKNKKYIICDATYINANLGQCMPRYKSVKPKVISILNHY